MQQEISQNESKQVSLELYNAISAGLNQTAVAASFIYLNYGYVAGDAPRRAKVNGGKSVGDVSADLILEAIGDCDLNGKDLLDVGCGRGGAISIIKRYFPQVKSLTGVDLSPEAIEFCRRAHAATMATFIAGDAENLPLPDESFDALINIESACVYPDVQAFYRQARRVLRPGGRFLYADCIRPNQIEARLEYLAGLGFVLDNQLDITEGVVRSCDAVGAKRFADACEGKTLTPEVATVVGNLLCVPGSRKYQKFAAGRERYLIFNFTKS